MYCTQVQAPPQSRSTCGFQSALDVTKDEPSHSILNKSQQSQPLRAISLSSPTEPALAMKLTEPRDPTLPATSPTTAHNPTSPTTHTLHLCPNLLPCFAGRPSIQLLVADISCWASSAGVPSPRSGWRWTKSLRRAGATRHFPLICGAY